MFASQDKTRNETRAKHDNHSLGGYCSPDGKVISKGVRLNGL